MAQEVAFSKYSSVNPYVKDQPSWVPPNHQGRIAAYSVYEEIYWSHVNVQYKVMNRGLDAQDEAAPRTKLWSILILSNGAFFK